MNEQRLALLAIVTALGMVLPTVSPLQAQNNTALPAITILKVSGQIAFTRRGWINQQPLVSGTLMMVSDLIFPQEATLLVMCPNGTAHEFLPSDLVPNATINCPTVTGVPVVGMAGTKSVNIQRGAGQKPTIPYLISPRATVVRSPNVTLRWNPIPDVKQYLLTVRGGGEMWTSDPLEPAKVVQDGVAQFVMDKPIQEKTPYSVEICVVFNTGRQHCTTDPDWSTGDNLAFYYVPRPVMDDIISQLIAGLGKNTPESLYARAVVLSQPYFVAAPGITLSANSEAIDLLQSLIKDNPQSALASSPDLYILLGDMYRTGGLPISATQIYERAAKLSQRGTESSARAAIGRAMTTPDSTTSIQLYNAALVDYATFLSPSAFSKQLAELCTQMNDISFDIARCNKQ